MEFYETAKSEISSTKLEAKTTFWKMFYIKH